MTKYELDKDADTSHPCSNDDDYILDLRIKSQNHYYGRWAAEKWLLCVYLRRCYRFLRPRFRPVDPAHDTSDDVPF
jgi:hypothetical protein